MMLIESAMAVRVRAGAGAGVRFNSTAAITNSCATRSSEDVAGVHITLRRLPHSRIFEIPGNRFLASSDGSLNKRKTYMRNRIRAARENSGSASEPINRNEKPKYHPFEEISESPLRGSGDARLTAAETTRTIIEVNSRATLMFSDLISDEVHENIFWPELPYVTDEHGNIYFQVKSDEDILQTLTSENNFVV